MVWGGPPSQPPITSPRRSQPKQATVIQPGQGNPDKNVTRQLFPNETKNRGGFGVPPSTSSNTTVSYTLASSTSKVTTSGSPVFTIKPDNSKQPLPSKPGQIRPPVPGNVKVLQRPGSHKQDPQPLPIISGQQNGPSAPPMMGPNGPFMPPNSPGGSFSPFNNLFSNVADQLLKKDDASERMNFASVAAAGVIGSLTNSSAASDLMATKVDPHIGPPPPAASPLTVSPKLSDQMKSEDRRPVGPIGGERLMRPIGSERAQRRAPGPIPGQPISAANDFGPAFWNITTGTVVITF